MGKAKKEKPRCEQCGQPGGRMIVDPYGQELFGDETKMRLHEQCAQARSDDI